MKKVLLLLCVVLLTTLCFACKTKAELPADGTEGQTENRTQVDVSGEEETDGGTATGRIPVKDPSALQTAPPIEPLTDPNLGTEPTIGVPKPIEPPLEIEGSNPPTPVVDDSLIVPLYDSHGSFEDGSIYVYRVPQLNFTSADAKAVNAEIAEQYGDLAREGIDAAQSGVYAACYEVDYQVIWYNDDIFALLLWSKFPNDCVYYDVYSFRHSNMKRLSNQDLLQLAGIGEKDFLQRAKTRAMEVFDETYAAVADDYQNDAFYQEQRERSASDENINMEMRMYLDRDDGLTLISAIGSIAGADSYEHIYPLAGK